MLHIQRGHIEAQVESGGSDEKVFHGDGDSLCGLLALDAPGELGDGQRDRMHDKVVEDSLAIEAAALTVADRFGPIDAMRQFHGADGR